MENANGRYYDEEQLNAIYSLYVEGAHLVALDGRKKAFMKGWRENKEPFDPTHPNAWGHIPGSLGLITVDVDKDLNGFKPGAGATPESMKLCVERMQSYLQGFIIHECESSPGTGKYHITCYSPGGEIKGGKAYLDQKEVGDIRGTTMQVRLEDPVGLLEAIKGRSQADRLPSYLVDGLRDSGEAPRAPTAASERESGDNRYSPAQIEGIVAAVAWQSGKKHWLDNGEWRIGNGEGSCKVRADDGRYFAFDKDEGGHLADLVCDELGLPTTHEALNWIEERSEYLNSAARVVDELTEEEEEERDNKLKEKAKSDLKEWMAIDRPLVIEGSKRLKEYPLLDPAKRRHFTPYDTQEYKRKLATRTDSNGNAVSIDQRKRDAEQYIYGVRDEHRVLRSNNDEVFGEDAHEVARLYLGRLKKLGETPPFRYFVDERNEGGWYICRNLGKGWVWERKSLDEVSRSILQGAKGLYWTVAPHANIEGGVQELAHLRPCTSRKDGWGTPFAKEIAGVLSDYAPVRLDSRLLNADKLLLVHPDGLGEHLLEDEKREVRMEEYRSITLAHKPADSYPEDSLPARVEVERFPDPHTRLWMMCHRGTMLIPYAFKKAAYVWGKGDAGKTTMAKQDQHAIGFDLLEIGTADALVRQKAKGKTVDYASHDTLFESEGKGGVYAEEAGGKGYQWDELNCKRCIGPGQMRVHAAGKGVKGFENTATWILTSNHPMPPVLHQPTAGRLCPVPYAPPLNDDPEMLQMLQGEANTAIHLRGLIDALKMVVKRTTLPPMSAESTAALSDAQEDGAAEDPVLAFLKRADIRVARADFVPVAVLEEVWKRHCDEHGLKCGGLRSTEFRRVAAEAGLGEGRKWINGEKVRCRLGISVVA